MTPPPADGRWNGRGNPEDRLCFRTEESGQHSLCRGLVVTSRRPPVRGTGCHAVCCFVRTLTSSPTDGGFTVSGSNRRQFLRDTVFALMSAAGSVTLASAAVVSTRTGKKEESEDGKPPS